MPYTTWFSYLSGLPINEGELWNALSALNTELEAVYDSVNVAYSYGVFYTGAVSSVAEALNEIADYLDAGGVPGGVSGLVIPSPTEDPLVVGTVYGRWVMPVMGTLQTADFRVETVPSIGDCVLGIYLNGVLQLSVTILSGSNIPVAITDCSTIAYDERDVLDVRCVTASLAGNLSGVIQ